MVGEVLLVLILAITLAQIICIGPGQQPKLLPFRIVADSESESDEKDGSEAATRSIKPPRIYQCDPQGYPIWCTACQSLKSNRTHHSSTLGYCIPRFDHYCVWIGTIVGRKNYRLFVQFAFYFWLFTIYMIASIASFLRRIIKSRSQIPRVNPNILVVLALCCMAMLMVGPLFLSHTYYMMVNRTSLEVIATKQRSKATKSWICYYNPIDGIRYVFEFKALEAQDFWRKRGVLNNLKEFLGDKYYMWLVPIGSNIENHTPGSMAVSDVLGPYEEVFGSQLEDQLRGRIESGEYITTFKAHGDQD